MSKTKNHYHEQIENSHGEEFLDDDYCFQQWEEEQEYEKYIEERAEQAKYEEIFLLTNTYPF